MIPLNDGYYFCTFNHFQGSPLALSNKLFSIFSQGDNISIMRGQIPQGLFLLELNETLECGSLPHITHRCY